MQNISFVDIVCLLMLLQEKCALEDFWTQSLNLQTDTKSIRQTHMSAQRRLIKTDKTKRFTTALEAESQG